MTAYITLACWFAALLLYAASYQCREGSGLLLWLAAIGLTLCGAMIFLVWLGTKIGRKP